MYVLWTVQVIDADIGPPPEKVTDMYLGHGWQSPATALADVMWHAWMYLAQGAVAIGSCWYGGEEAYRAWQDYEREARSRRRERRVQREAARGLTQIEHYLGN